MSGKDHVRRCLIASAVSHMEKTVQEGRESHRDPYTLRGLTSLFNTKLSLASLGLHSVDEIAFTVFPQGYLNVWPLAITK